MFEGDCIPLAYPNLKALEYSSVQGLFALNTC